MEKPPKPASVEEYFGRLPDDQRLQLERIRSIILENAPTAEERIAYDLPCFYVNRKPLMCIGGFKKHSSVFGIGPDLQEQFGNELEGFKQSKGTIQFTEQNPLPDDLVERMVRWRLKIIESGTSSG